MRVESMKIELTEEDDYVDVKLNTGATIGISAKGIMVSNNHEERIYHLRKTPYGGFKLEEGTLL